MTTDEIQQTQVKTTHFFNRIKTVNSHNKINKNHPTIHIIIYHQLMMIIINQIFLHHIHKNTVQNHFDQIKHPKIQIFIHKT